MGGEWHLPTSGKKTERGKKGKKKRKSWTFHAAATSPGEVFLEDLAQGAKEVCQHDLYHPMDKTGFGIHLPSAKRDSEIEVMSSNFPWLPVMPETDTLTPREDDGEIAGPSHFHKNSRELLPYLLQN